MASDTSKERAPKKYGDMPDKWDDWHVRLPDPKEQLRDDRPLSQAWLNAQ